MWIGPYNSKFFTMCIAICNVHFTLKNLEVMCISSIDIVTTTSFLRSCISLGSTTFTQSLLNTCDSLVIAIQGPQCRRPHMHNDDNYCITMCQSCTYIMLSFFGGQMLCNWTIIYLRHFEGYVIMDMNTKRSSSLITYEAKGLLPLSYLGQVLFWPTTYLRVYMWPLCLI